MFVGFLTTSQALPHMREAYPELERVIKVQAAEAYAEARGVKRASGLRQINRYMTQATERRGVKRPGAGVLSAIEQANEEFVKANRRELRGCEAPPGAKTDEVVLIVDQDLETLVKQERTIIDNACDVGNGESGISLVVIEPLALRVAVVIRRGRRELFRPRRNRWIVTRLYWFLSV
ncbi:MAG: hypothetical protein QXZ36_03735 [Thermoproteota archaeon]